jgi:hypothetical protein
MAIPSADAWREPVCCGVPEPAWDAAPPGLRPLPPAVARLLRDLDAPPRLVAHLALVHAAAADVADRLATHWPALRLDRDALLVGAATHDVGKAAHREELTGPGRRHEAAGERLLIQQGFPPAHARFARTHGGPARDPHPALEDWLVAVADAVWKGARDGAAEEGLRAAVADATGEPAWEVFSALDDILAEVADGADRRLAWHAAQPP